MSARRLTIDEVEVYQKIRAEMLVDTPGSFARSPGDDRFRDAAFVEGVLSHATNRIYGYFDAGGECQSVAGFVREEPLKRQHVGQIYGVYTRPGGRRQGASMKVIQGLIDYAQGLEGVEMLQLTVSSEAPAAQALYERLGFQVWGREPKALRLGSDRPDEVHMWLDLSAS